MKKNLWWLSIFCALAAALGMDQIQPASAQSSGPNRAALVVAFGDGSVESRCVEFSTETITGLEALQAVGLSLEVDYNSVGAAVCKIGNVGCPADDCFCDSPPNFWSYWHLVDGSWVFSQIGSGMHNLRNGDVDGWIWGVGQSNPPPPASFEQVCAEQPTPTASPTSTATQTPTEAPTETPVEQPTRAPSATPLPEIDPTATLEPTLEVAELPADLNLSAGATAGIYIPLVSKIPAPPQDVPAPTAAAPTSTPAAAAQVVAADAAAPDPALQAAAPAPQQTAPAPQTAAGGARTAPDSGNLQGDYLSLGAIVAGLAIALFVVAQKKWK